MLLGSVSHFFACHHGDIDPCHKMLSAHAHPNLCSPAAGLVSPKDSNFWSADGPCSLAHAVRGTNARCRLKIDSCDNSGLGPLGAGIGLSLLSSAGTRSGSGSGGGDGGGVGAMAPSSDTLGVGML